MKKKKISEKFFIDIIKKNVKLLNTDGNISHKQFMTEIEKCLIEQMLEKYNGHRVLTAKALSLIEQTLRYKMKILDIKSLNRQGQQFKREQNEN